MSQDVLKSINPWNGESIAEYEIHSSDKLESILEQSKKTFGLWREFVHLDRKSLLEKMAILLQAKQKDIAEIITKEMGKLYSESIVEVEKCIWLCEWYSQYAADLLEEEIIETDASKSGVSFQAIGSVLGIMPWNFPFWQAFRFIVPTIMAGNTVVLKHASNVTGCALLIETLFREVGFLEGVVSVVKLKGHSMEWLISHECIKGVAITGSEKAGRSVASVAGKNLKPHVLELGGSDPFIVLEGADLSVVIPNAIKARFANSGQVCIAAKRFIIHESLYDEFVEKMGQYLGTMSVGDPMASTTQLAPLAKVDLCAELQYQVDCILREGAKRVLGSDWSPIDGCCFNPSLFTNVEACESARLEMFGPVALVYKARNEKEALELGNDTEFGLGASIWSGDSQRALQFGRQIEAGIVFVNGLVKSDPRLPFGGSKSSGYGRELAKEGIRTFTNSQTFWVK